MAKTLWVQANPSEKNIRKVVLSEVDEAHPTPTGEVWIVAYEEPRFDSEGNPVEPSNPPVQVGDTPGVRAALQAQDLIEVDAPMGRRQATTTSSPAGTADHPFDTIVGTEFREKLVAAGYQSPDDIRAASDEQLLDVDGIGPKTVEKLRAAYGKG